MNEYILLKFLHLLGFTYWLGGDLGTYLASRHAVKPDIEGGSRRTAISIMLACDLGPRLAMPMMFSLGFHMAQISGVISSSITSVYIAWAIGIVWLLTAAYLGIKHSSSKLSAALAKLDLIFRILFSAALIIWSIKELVSPAMINAHWLSIKILFFALTIVAGIAVRISLKDFGPALMKITETPTDKEAAITLQKSILGCRPWVWFIWFALFINTALGIHLIG